jgi:hypothetical protein
VSNNKKVQRVPNREVHEEPLDQQLKTFYTAQSLSTFQLDQIKKKKNTLSFPTPPRKSNSFFYQVAAILLLCVGVASLSIVFKNPHLSKNIQGDLYQSYLEEVAYNHQKKVPSDIVSSSISKINQGMEKLGFQIYIPQQVAREYNVLGARYCSVSNNIATQVNLRNHTGNTATLYIAQSTPDFLSENISVIYKQVKNTHVTMWGEETLRFFLVTDKESL